MVPEDWIGGSSREGDTLYELNVRFDGPFSWKGAADAPSVASAAVARRPGVYLWTVRTTLGVLIYYVGETGRSFVARMREHYKEHAAGFYHLHDPAAFARGEKSLVWPGAYDNRDRKSPEECMAAYLEIAPVAAELAGLYRFFLAELDVDRRLRERVEAALANQLYGSDGVVGAFQDEGVRYHPRRSDEQPIVCGFESPVGLVGLPRELMV